MKNYQPYLYNRYGDKCVRKNKQILYYLNNDISSQELGNYLDDMQKYKANHTKFMSDLKKQIKSINLDTATYDSKEKRLIKRLEIAKRKETFYKSYIQLSYDAQLEYEIAVQELKEIPSILKNYQQIKLCLQQAQIELQNISEDDENKIEAQHKTLKNRLNNELKQDIIAVKTKYHNGLISKTAYINAVKAIKRQKKDILNINKFNSKKTGLKANIKALTYQLKYDIKRDLKVLESNISDIMRKTPIEVQKIYPRNSYISMLFPGIGQLLNKQFIKAILFGLGSLFIYFIAIPYVLGHGNYQGNGIFGLISLAAGGKKIDKSLIYMIEGIVSIFLLLFSFVIYILSFHDVRTVEKNSINGIRANRWIDTKNKIEQDGFPYMVSLPALIVIIFIVLVPIATTILLSFTNMDPKHQSKFIWAGIENYKLIATGSGIAGTAFWKILGWTLLWTIFATTLPIIVGFLLAVIVNNERIKGKLFFRSVFLLPWAVPAFITIMFFSIMFSQNGIITSLLNTYIGFDIVVKSDPFYSRMVLILLQTWLGSSYIFLLSTGVLQAIPADLYEAASIDGASSWQKLRYITLPMVLFQTAPLLVSQYTFNFNNFSIIYLFNEGGPFNPMEYGNLAGTTDLLISYVYKLIMVNQYQAIGAAITVVISFGLIIFAFIGFKNSKSFKEEG